MIVRVRTSLEDDGWMEVEGDGVGDFLAIHREVGEENGWALTHLVTGLNVFTHQDRGRVENIAAAVVGEDWNFKTKETCPEQTRLAVKSAQKREELFTCF